MAVSSNGIGRYVCQLKRLTFNYCPVGGSSRGMREFIEKSVNKLSETNPTVAIYVTKRHGRHPRIVANFINSNSKVVDVKNSYPPDIQSWVEKLKSESGLKRQGIPLRWHTENPSTQGTWTPYINQASCRLDLEENARQELNTLK